MYIYIYIYNNKQLTNYLTNHWSFPWDYYLITCIIMY